MMVKPTPKTAADTIPQKTFATTIIIMLVATARTRSTQAPPARPIVHRMRFRCGLRAAMKPKTGIRATESTLEMLCARP